MSIINQMLRDLDARQASASERAGLPGGLRTLPPEPVARSKTWLLLPLGLVVGAMIAWYFASRQTSSPAVMPVPETPPPSQTSAQSSVPPVAVPATQAPAPQAKSVATPAPVAKVPPPVAKAPAKPESPAVQPAERREKPAAAPIVEAAPAGETQIEKQPQGGATRGQAEAEYRKGMQAAGSGDLAAAIPALRRALEIDAKHVKARQALLSVLAANRQWDEVRQVAQSGLALDPTRTGWASILARLQHEQGDTAGAVKTLETHAAHAIGDADYQGTFAFLLQKRQRYAEAAQHYQAALALRPGEGRWWFGLGLALEAAGRGDEAKTAFGRARDSGNLPVDMLGVIEQKLR